MPNTTIDDWRKAAASVEESADHDPMFDSIPDMLAVIDRVQALIDTGAAVSVDQLRCAITPPVPLDFEAVKNACNCWSPRALDNAPDQAINPTLHQPDCPVQGLVKR